MTLFAGPNGSGKSTLIALSNFQSKQHLIDADAIARELDPANPATAAIDVGREVLRRIQEYLDRNLDFGIEMTLASLRHRKLIHAAKNRGYRVHLVFTALADENMCIFRVHIRSARGGHFIPEADVRRRYARSVANCLHAIRIVDAAKIYDNSGDGHRLVLVAEGGQIVWQADSLPAWLKLP